MRFAQICDRVEAGAASKGRVDFSAFTGLWVNSNPETSGIARLLTSEADGGLSVRVYAVGPDGLMDWGTAAAEVFASSPSSRVAAGFTCVFDFGFAEARLQGMILKGLLVLAQFHSFKDASGRADYFVREYYALRHDRY